jgi:hypothetical protein
MSTLRISNIEAKSVPASATIDEKVKITNSSGDVLVFLDGKTSGITTVGINTTDGNITFDANSNVVVTGIITATRFSGQITPTSLEIGSNIKLGNAGVITATSFVGSGAQLTGITSPAITSIDNDAVSRVLTTDGDGTATAHSEVKIETVSGNKRFSINRGTGSTEVPLLVRRTDASGIVAEFSNSSGYGVYIGQNGATGEGYIRTATGQPLVFTTNAGSGIANERLRIGTAGQIGIAGANYGTSGQVLMSQGSGSTVQWASPVVAGSILQTVYNTTTSEGQTTSSSFQNWSGLATNITPLSSSSHLWIWINAIRLNVQQDGNEGRLRVTDGTNSTEIYRCFNYDSDGNYLSFNPCLNWYWPQTHTAGTQITLTPQLRSMNGSGNVIWGDNGDTSMMIIQEIAR